MNTPKIDRATVEYIHNEWEFADMTEDEFDEWLHELIKAARGREVMSLDQIDGQETP